MSGNGGQKQAVVEETLPETEPHPAETAPATPPQQEPTTKPIACLADIAALAEAKDENVAGCTDTHTSASSRS